MTRRRVIVVRRTGAIGWRMRCVFDRSRLVDESLPRAPPIGHPRARRRGVGFRRTESVYLVLRSTKYDAMVTKICFIYVDRFRWILNTMYARALKKYLGGSGGPPVASRPAPRDARARERWRVDDRRRRDRRPNPPSRPRPSRRRRPSRAMTTGPEKDDDSAAAATARSSTTTRTRARTTARGRRGRQRRRRSP